MNKKLTGIILAAVIMLCGTASLASGVLPDHSGTSASGIAIGTAKLNTAVKSYSELFSRAGNQYGVDPNLLAAICMQESSGRNLSYRTDGSEYPAWGIMQIEYTNEKSFAQFGLNTTGVEWTLSDRLDPEKSISYAAWVISKSLIAYDCDYLKMIQSYNFGQTVLDRIIEAKGDDWLGERINAAKYADNWKSEKYGDAEYIEHVLRYYHNDIEYLGAKVRINGRLVEFEDQYPIIDGEYTLIPIRGVSELLDADVDWEQSTMTVTIKYKEKTVKLSINSDTAYVNGNAVKLEAPAKILNDRTMLPIRFIMDIFDADVAWEQDTRTVLITEAPSS